MTEKIKKIIDEEIEKMPKETQALLATVNWAEITEKIAFENELLEEETDMLLAEVLIVITGKDDAWRLPRNIENALQISADTIEKIAREIYKQIIFPLGKQAQKNIKEKIQKEKIDWKKNVEFILSGGDYSVFIRKEGADSGEYEEEEDEDDMDERNEEKNDGLQSINPLPNTNDVKKVEKSEDKQKQDKEQKEKMDELMKSFTI